MTQSTTTPQILVELAVFTTTHERFSELQISAHQDLSSFRGYLASIPLVHPQNSNLRADLVLWDSDESAQSAASSIGKDERFKDFVSSIQSIKVFAHYSGIDSDAFALLAHAPFVELAGYPIGGALEQSAREKIHDALAENAGTRITVAARLQGHKEEATKPGALDIIGWSSEEAFKSAPHFVLKKYPELKPLFEGSKEEMPVFDLFVAVKG